MTNDDYEDSLPELEPLDEPSEEQEEEIEEEIIPKKKKKSSVLKSNVDFIKEETQRLVERLQNEDEDIAIGLAEQIAQYIAMNVINDSNELIVFCERWKTNLINDIEAQSKEQEEIE